MDNFNDNLIDQNEFDEIFASFFGDEAQDSPDSFPAEVYAPQAAESEDSGFDPELFSPVEAPKAEQPADEEEIVFDPRFRIDRGAEKHRGYSYNGNRVSSTQELDYAPSAAPEYEELRSSYGVNDGLDNLLDPQPESAEPEPEKKKGLKGLFSGKRKAAAEEDDFEQPDFNDPSFYAGLEQKLQAEKERISEDFEALGADDVDVDFAPSSFKEYLSSRIAAVALKIHGGVPADAAEGTMDSEDEELGEELAPLSASKYYGSIVFSMRLRTRIAFGLTLIAVYLSLGIPAPGMLSNLRTATAAVLAIEFTVMLLALDNITNAVLNAFRGIFGADALAVISCIATALDAVSVLSGTSDTNHMPFCAASCISMCGVMFSSVLAARSLRKTLRVPAIAKTMYTVSSSRNIVSGREGTLLKTSGTPEGFLRRAEQTPIDENMYRKLSVFILAFSLLMALLATVIERSFINAVYIISVFIASCVPFTALVAFPLPFFTGAMRIFSEGSAIAGWSGACDIGRSETLIVTDADIFPPECIEIENVRIFADYPSDKVISYAGSIIVESGCGLSKAFLALMDENNAPLSRLDSIEYLAGGGMKALIEGHTVICGNCDLMRLMDIRIPYRLVSGQCVLLAIDGVLYGIFNITYTPDPKVRKALVSLMRSNRHPIFAVRDFNITPDMIRESFDVATDGYDFPPYIERFPISQARPSAESETAALVCREGLGPLTAMADTGRSIYVVSRINTIISVASAFAGVITVFIKLVMTGSVSVTVLMLFMLITGLPVVILGLLTNAIE